MELVDVVYELVQACAWRGAVPFAFSFCFVRACLVNDNPAPLVVVFRLA